jgi:photosystem II stability/assembly factor-like uncharacterized protein
MLLSGAAAACSGPSSTNPDVTVTTDTGAPGMDSGAPGDDSAVTPGDDSAVTPGNDAAVTPNDSGAPAGAWTRLSLPDDGALQRGSNDIVTAIRFDSLDRGWLATMGFAETAIEGGAIYNARAGAVTGLALSGRGLDDGQNVGFRDIQPTPRGLWVGTSQADLFVSSSDHGMTFTAAPSGLASIDRVLWGSVDASDRWWIVASAGVLWSTTGTPSATSSWDPVWAPERTPTIPDPIPDGACDLGPRPENGELPYRYGYVSPDGQRQLYLMRIRPPRVCLSEDAGRSFYPVVLPSPPEGGAGPDGNGLGPYGIVFTDAMHGWIYYGNDLQDDSAYVYRTTDGGHTWSLGALPTALLAPGARVALTNLFFAPDAMHGWVVGYSSNDTNPLLLRTDDGGAHWSDISTSVRGAPGVHSPQKLYSGFALDATHIWLGGDQGLVLYNDHGGSQ